MLCTSPALSRLSLLSKVAGRRCRGPGSCSECRRQLWVLSALFGAVVFSVLFCGVLSNQPHCLVLVVLSPPSSLVFELLLLLFFCRVIGRLRHPGLFAALSCILLLLVCSAPQRPNPITKLKSLAALHRHIHLLQPKKGTKEKKNKTPQGCYNNDANTLMAIQEQTRGGGKNTYTMTKSRCTIIHHNKRTNKQKKKVVKTAATLE